EGRVNLGEGTGILRADAWKEHDLKEALSSVLGSVAPHSNDASRRTRPCKRKSESAARSQAVNPHGLRILAPALTRTRTHGRPTRRRRRPSDRPSRHSADARQRVRRLSRGQPTILGTLGRQPSEGCATRTKKFTPRRVAPAQALRGSAPASPRRRAT